MEDAALIKKEIILSSAEISSSVVTLVVVVQSLWNLFDHQTNLKCDTCYIIFNGLLLFLMVGKKENPAINLLIINNSSEFILSGL